MGARARIAGLLAMLLLVTAPNVAAADDARAWQGGLEHSGHIPGDSPAPLKRLWSRDLDGATSHPVIADGRVFTVSYNSQAGDSMVLHALDARTGVTLWSAPLPSPGTVGSNRGLAYADGRLLVGGTGMAVRAYDPATGLRLWSSVKYVDSAPIVHDGVVYVTEKGTLRALRSSDGTMLWEKVLSSSDLGMVSTDGTSLWTTSPCHIYRVTIATRVLQAQWGQRCSHGGGTGTPPVISGTSAYWDYTILSNQTFNNRGSYASPFPVAVAGDKLFTSASGKLTARPTTGDDSDWTFWDFTGDGHLNTQPLVIGDQVFIGSSTGRLFAVDADSGELLWRDRLAGGLDGPAGDCCHALLFGLGAGDGLVVAPSTEEIVAYEHDPADPGPGDIDPPDTTLEPTTALIESDEWAPEYSSDDLSATFECRIDRGVWADCGPNGFPEMRDGRHVIAVRAVDPSGNADPTPPTDPVEVDGPPDTSILYGPEDWAPADFEFDINADERDVTFECRLDGGTWVDCDSHSDWSGTIDYTGVAEGTHTFETRAIDPAGHADPTPASRIFRVDATAPRLAVEAPADRSETPSAAPVVFSGTTSQDEGDTGRVTLGIYRGVRGNSSDSYTVATQAANGAWSVAVPLEDDIYTYAVQTRDLAGNPAQWPAVYRTVTVGPRESDTTLTKKPAALTTAREARFRWTTTHDASTFECRLDSGAWYACDPGNSDEYVTNLADGEHEFAVRATNVAGVTESTPAVHTWRVDGTAPALAITSPSPGATTEDSTPTVSGTAGNDPGDGPVTVYVRETNSYTPIRTHTAQVSDGRWSVDIAPGLRNGNWYRVYAVRRDEAGNVRTAAEQSLTIARPTDTRIDSAPPRYTPSREAEFTFSSPQPGVTFECQLDSASWQPCESPHRVTVTRDGDHEFRVAARDEVGNDDPSPAYHRWAADTRAPTVAFTGPGAGATLTRPDVVIAGTSTYEPGDLANVVVRVWPRGDTSGAPLRELTDTEPSPGAFYTSTELPNGDYTAVAEQRDQAGHVATAHRDFTVAAPTPPPDDPPPPPVEEDDPPPPTDEEDTEQPPPPAEDETPPPEEEQEQAQTPPAETQATPSTTGEVTAPATAAEHAPPASAQSPPHVLPAGPPASPPPMPGSPRSLDRMITRALRDHGLVALGDTFGYESGKPGTLTVRVVERRGKKRVVLATARLVYKRAGGSEFTMKVTGAGKKMLRAATAARVDVAVTFAAPRR